jgi:oligopeptide transport system permease protein
VTGQSLFPPRDGQRGAALMRAATGRTLWDDTGRRFWRNPGAVIGVSILALLAAAAIIGPALLPYGYDQINKDDVWRGPLSGAHWLGADALGRDLLARLLVGLRVSLAIGVVATSVSLLLGVLWGATAGYVGGQVDEAMMRVVDVLYSLPFIFFVILLMVVFGRNFVLIFVAIGAVEWLTMSRIVRGQTLSLKHAPFVDAARVAGLSGPAIVARHITPNLLGPVIVYAALTTPAVILAESFLSFLGLGVQEPLTSLGVLISKGAQDMEVAPWLLIFPSLVMALTLISFNLIGDGLRDAIDPRNAGRTRQDR